MTQTIATDSPFGQQQRILLTTLAEWMIPAEDGLPSAADATILEEIIVALARQPEVTNAGLQRLDAIAKEQFRSPVPKVTSSERIELIAALRAEAPAFVTLFESTVAACYYRDDRVLHSLDLPARAPFPEGNNVRPTDWSLLDPVRQRAPFYRNV